MAYKSLGKRAVSSILAMSFMASGCLPTAVKSTRAGIEAVEGTTGGTTSGTTVGGSTGGVTPPPPTSLGPTVEIRHLIEPNLSYDPSYSTGTGFAGGGSYVRKMTLPKNYAGKLYLAGINIGTLADRHVRVRFKFGMGHEPVIIPAVVTTAPGITPQTNIHVLVMDLRGEPFRNMRLPYDLYDYNEYENTDKTPAQDNRDSGLFCRGLKLDDDPTRSTQGQCKAAGDKCLYSYAKVMDQGLVKTVINGTSTTFVPMSPTLPQARSVLGNSYYQDSMSKHLMKPLVDNIIGPFKFSEPSVPSTLTDAIALTFASGAGLNFNAERINNVDYYYRGPYRLVNTAEWQAKYDDLAGPNKLFREKLPFSASSGPALERPFIYFGSYMFPLATQLNLSANVPHLSSDTWNGERGETTLSVAGKTQWMDGSNARAQSKNSNLEHVGSCNVVAKIEIIAKDVNLNDYVIADSKDVKLQLVRPIQYFTDLGNDVLYSNFKTCSSNASCGGSECCFNNRCWDQSLVSQCFETNASTGNVALTRPFSVVNPSEISVSLKNGVRSRQSRSASW